MQPPFDLRHLPQPSWRLAFGFTALTFGFTALVIGFAALVVAFGFAALDLSFGFALASGFAAWVVAFGFAEAEWGVGFGFLPIPFDSPTVASLPAVAAKASSWRTVSAAAVGVAPSRGARGGG
jgi:hypothetical protein